MKAGDIFYDPDAQGFYRYDPSAPSAHLRQKPLDYSQVPSNVLQQGISQTSLPIYDSNPYDQGNNLTGIINEYQQRIGGTPVTEQDLFNRFDSGRATINQTRDLYDQQLSQFNDQNDPTYQQRAQLQNSQLNALRGVGSTFQNNFSSAFGQPMIAPMQNQSAGTLPNDAQTNGQNMLTTQQMPNSFLQGASAGSFPLAQTSSSSSPSVSTASTSAGGGIPSGFVSNVDPQIKQAFLENYEFAKGVANQPYQAYTGPRVAQFSGDQQLLFDKVRQMANQPQSFLAGNINQYMNPYQDEVINRFQTDLERQRQLADQDVNANAVSRGAFGGSRQAVAQSENTRNFMDTSARNLANLRAQGFDTAAQLMQSDINRANQGLNFLGQTGALQQGQVQRNYDTAYQDFLQQRDYPLKQLQIRGMGLGQNLPNFGIQQTPQTPQTNTAANAIGGALIGSQIGSGFGSGFLGSNTGQILGAIGGGLLGGFL